jgi:hypothetical protein
VGNTVYPVAADLWRHHKGDLYQVLCRALLEHDQTEVVVYANVKSGPFWVRPLSEFLEKFTKETGADR